MRLPFGICNYVVSTSIGSKMYLPSHWFRPDRYTSTFIPAGSASSILKCSFPFGAPIRIFTNANFQRVCSFLTSSDTFYMTVDICNCVGDGVVRAGLGIVPKTKMVGHSPSGPIVLFKAWEAILKK